MLEEFSIVPAPGNDEYLFTPKREDDYKIIIEQYKMLVESINKVNDTRELSNGFWIGANGFGLSLLAYLRDAQTSNCIISLSY